MTQSEKLRFDRAKLLEQAGALNAQAEKDNRDFTGDEKSKYDAMIADASSLMARARRMEEQDSLQKDLTSIPESIVNPARGASTGNSHMRDMTVLNSPEYHSAQMAQWRGDNRPMMQYRDQNTTTPADGGLTISPITQKEFFTTLTNTSVVRKAGAKVLSTNSRTNINAGGAVTGTWEAERGNYNNGADSDMVITQFAAVPRKYTMRSTFSEELLFDSDQDVVGLVTTRFAEGFDEASDNCYVVGVGSGSNQPTGIFTGGTDNVVVSATTSTAAEIVAHFHKLKSKFRTNPTCGWLASDKFVGHAAALSRNPDNGVFFKYGERVGEPDQLMYKPVYVSPGITETWTANAEIAAVVCFNQYQIVDFVRYTSIMRLNEQSALSGAVVFAARYATDGKLMDQAAAQILKLASS